MQLCLSEWESAKAALTTAKKYSDIAYFFHDKYKSIPEFEKRFHVTLPAEIKTLLT